MRIVLMGDSITDMERDRTDNKVTSYGFGYGFFLQGYLSEKYPQEHTIYNKGISGNRTVDLYARIKQDCWNYQPDLLSILIGVNDLWHDIEWNNGVEIDRFERIYRMYIEDTKKVLPNVKLMILEPSLLKYGATEAKWDEFVKIKDYAKVVKKIAEDYNAVFVPLQERLEKLAEKNTPQYYLYDGVHPSVAGAKVIADAWIEVFEKMKKD